MHRTPYMALFIRANMQNVWSDSGCQEGHLFQQHTLAKMLTLGIFANSQLSPRAAQIWFNTVQKAREELDQDALWKVSYVNVNLQKVALDTKMFSVTLNSGSKEENQ